MTRNYIFWIFFQLLFFAGFLSQNCTAQSQAMRLDSLLKLLPHIKPSSLFYQQLAEAYLEIDNQKALRYAQKAYELAKASGQVLDVQEQKLTLGIVYRYIGKNFESLSLLEEVQHYANKNEDKDLLVRVLSNLGKLNFVIGNKQTALKYFLEVREMDISETLWLDYVGYTWLARIYISQKMYDKALYCLAKDLAYFERRKIFNPSAYSEIGNVYYAKKEYDTAYVWYEKAYKKELLNDKAAQNIHALGYLCGNMGLIKAKQRLYTNALSLYDSALKHSYQSRSNSGIANIKSNLSQLYFETKDFQKAIEAGEEGYAMAQDARDYERLIELAERLIQAYEAQNQNKMAYFYQGQKISYMDTLAHFKQESDILAIQFQEKVALKRKEMQELELENTRFFYVILLISIGTAALLVIAFLAIRASKLHKKYWQEAHEKSQIRQLMLDEERSRNDLQDKYNTLEQERLQDKIDLQARKLAAQSDALVQKNNWLIEIEEKLKEKFETMPSDEAQMLKQEFKQVLSEIKQGLNQENDWINYKQHFQEVHPAFFQSIKRLSPSLTNHDLRLAAYLKMNLSNKEIAQIFNITDGSLRVALTRFKQKLDISKETDLRAFIQAFDEK